MPCIHHSKQSIPYNQALILNRIFSNNNLFDKRCNQFEDWLCNWLCNWLWNRRVYSNKAVRNQILAHPWSSKSVFWHTHGRFSESILNDVPYVFYVPTLVNLPYIYMCPVPCVPTFPRSHVFPAGGRSWITWPRWKFLSKTNIKMGRGYSRGKSLQK